MTISDVESTSPGTNLRRLTKQSKNEQIIKLNFEISKEKDDEKTRGKSLRKKMMKKQGGKR